MIFAGEELTRFEFVREEYEKKTLRTTVLDVSDKTAAFQTR